MAGTISFDGLATGIKTADTVDKLIEVESRPKILKEAEKTRLDNKLAAWREVNSKLLSVSVAAGDLSRLATWNTQKVTSSDDSLLTAKASLAAATGTYTVTVDRLARAHQVGSQGFATSNSTLGSGALNLQVGTGAIHTIQLTSANNTLEGTAKAINDAKIGVTASVVNTGTEYKLLLASNATGEANALTVTKDVGVNLAFDFGNPVQAAQNAQVRLGSGAGAIVVESASNNVSTLIQGVTLDLAAADETKQVTVSVSRNSDAIAEKVQAFVDAYNDTMSYVSAQFSYDGDKDVAGVLMGDTALMGVQRNLSSFVLRSVANGSSYRALSSVGVTVGDGGKLSFDASKLSAGMLDDFEGVMRLFRSGGDTTHAKVSYVHATSKTVESAAGYAVDVTQVATRGSVAAYSAAGLAIDETNDTLTLSVDGGVRVTVSLAHKADYTAETLAAEVQAKINGAISGKVTVTAAGGLLSLTSDRYGSASKIAIGEGTALATLGLAAGASGAGQDVAGTINGEAATGTGQILKGNAGNANTDGLQVLVELTDGLVDGPEATLTFTKGVFSRFEEYLSGLTDPISGTVGTQQSSITKSLETVQEQIKTMEARLATKRESLLAQFQAMEKAVGALNSQGNYLTNALSGLSANWKWNA